MTQKTAPRRSHWPASVDNELPSDSIHNELNEALSLSMSTLRHTLSDTLCQDSSSNKGLCFADQSPDLLPQAEPSPQRIPFLVEEPEGVRIIREGLMDSPRNYYDDTSCDDMLFCSGSCWLSILSYPFLRISNLYLGHSDALLSICDACGLVRPEPLHRKNYEGKPNS